ncbi:MAG: EAL domain-containing protein [Actinobacteria bacterium]|nr:EAL domain-containing protein [Actinomycetota bacterium]
MSTKTGALHAYVPFYGWMATMFALLVSARGLAVQLAAILVGGSIALSLKPDWGTIAGGISWMIAVVGIAVFVYRIRSLFGRRLRRERDRLEVELQEELGRRLAREEEYRQLIETLPLVTYAVLLDEEGAPTVYASPQLEKLLGYPVEDWLAEGGMWDRLIHPDDRERNEAAFQAHIESGRPTRTEYRLLTRDGRWKWFLDDAVVVSDAGGRRVSRGFMVDITERKELESQLAFQAFHDSLTGLANRALFRDRLEHALARRREETVAIVYLDVDDFKDVNDDLGHAAGDELIRLTAERMLRSVRAGDTVARVGGDEFAILVEDHGERAAQRIVSKLLEVFREPVTIAGREFEVTVSVGTATSTPGIDADVLIQRADLAMYAVKSRGKGGHEQYSDELSSRSRDRLAIRSDLRRAIADGGLDLFYQPIVELPVRATIGAEALIRWNHPTRGLVMPMDFIPVAEEAGLIVELGRWAIARAAETCVAIRRDLELPGFFVTVNLSARELAETDLPAFISQATAAAGLSSDGLIVEITESLLLSDPEGAVERLEALRSQGIRVALDDFGTGYSSLSYLGRLPVDLLKIAKPFVDAIGTASRDERLLRALVSLCADLDLTVVAEGIERAEQADYLDTLGCRLGQGWLFTPALEYDEVVAHIRRSRTPQGGRSPLRVG